jgi:long-chain acyl-CoA synthetase
LRTTAELVRFWAVRRPAAAATWFEGRTRTWAELDRLTDELAAGLVDRLGLQPGDHLAILDQNSDDYLALLYACDKAGLVATLLNWRLTGREVAQLVRDAEATCIVAGEAFRSTADAAGVRVIGFDELPRVAGGRDPGRDDERRVFWQLYTSGTTGMPKGAMITGHNLFSTICNFATEMPEIRVGARCLVPMPLYHTGGCGWCTAVLLHGGTAVILRELDPEEVLRTIVEQEVSVGFVVPALLLALTRTPYAQSGDFSRLTSILYGASPIARPVLESAIETFHCRFTQCYGLTETTGPITFLHHEDHKGDRLLSCGRATFGSQLEVVDTDGRELPRGEIGEIVYRGPGTIEGYWKRPEDTAAAIRGGWFHTGDAGTQDDDGYFYIKDRVRDMIVSGAENVYPAEIESVVAAHPGIADVTVIGVPDERWGETVKAIVVRRPEAPLLSEAEVIEWARPRLAGYKRPHSVDFVEALPRNPSGKVLKRELRERYWQGVGRRVN